MSSDEESVDPGAVSRRGFLAILGAAASAGGVSPTVAAAPAVGQGPSELTRATVVQIAGLIRSRKVSSLEVVSACLERIAHVNPRLNAVVLLDADRARDSARAADQALSRGEMKGPLHGVPMTIKDSFDTAGLISTGGTPGRKAFVPEHDATVVARLRAAGAILLGKTNTPELTWSFETRNVVYGRTNNPWNPDLSPGGSSGGAAAIVAACGVPFDIGSDTGGSIRVPSHFCGTAGIKPTSGRVPRTGHIVGAAGHAQSLTQLGPMARSVEDLSLLLGIIAGPDGRDPFVAPAPLHDPSKVSLRGLRVALHVDNGLRAPSPEFAKVLKAAAGALAGQGVEVEEQRPEALKDVLILDDDLFRSDGGSWLRRLLDRAGTREPSADVAASMGNRLMTSPEFSAFLERWDLWRGSMLRFLEGFDAILCPPCALDALPHGFSDGPDPNPAFSYTFAYNMTGWPAGVVRAGTSARGLPLGVQIVGRPWREDVVLALAGAIERGFVGFQPAPV
jgi:amidase